MAPPPEDFALSNEEIDESAEGPKSTDLGATKSTATTPNPFTVPGTDFGAYKSAATTSTPFKAPGGASSGTNPFKAPQAGGASSANLASELSDIFSRSKDLLSQADKFLSGPDEFS